jgi:HEAT repeat protein
MPDPEIAQPLWMEALEGADEERVVAALDTMSELGPAIVPRAIAALEYEKSRPYVAYILGKLGPDAAPAVDALAKYVDDPDEDVRKEVLFALGKIGPAAKGAVPAIVAAMEKHTGSTCYGLCYALGQIGPEAVAAKPALLKLVDSDDESAALFAAWALTQIEPECSVVCSKAVPVLVKGLADKDSQFRLGAAEGLCCLGKGAKAAVEALNKALEDDDKNVREAAAEALKAIGQ